MRRRLEKRGRGGTKVAFLAPTEVGLIVVSDIVCAGGRGGKLGRQWQIVPRQLRKSISRQKIQKSCS